MYRSGRIPVLLALFCCWSLKATAADHAGSSTIQFNRDIRPILTDNCFPCHGFDGNKRKANLRLDTAEGLVAVHDGKQAVQPGKPETSELWRRVKATDPKVMMPPPDFGKKLKPEQLDLLQRWIREGAAYQKHWAFEAPVKPPIPPVKKTEWPRNDIDRFILATLEARELAPSPEAAKETWLRRVTLDLTGLSPTLQEIADFLADARPDAYERTVDRLLNSPRYGEHMARYWLDVARYGDTHGLHLDNERSLWPYRDWVVRAFNENLSFDQFTIWQLAGDLLPNPTRDQLIASGFNRCNVSTSEGGAIDEEFQVRYAVDRVETTSATWMGLTMGCAVCHDHKLDPIAQKEFYEVFSIFNNISEKAMDGNALLPPPVLALPSPEQEKALADLDRQLRELDNKATEVARKFDYVDPASLNPPPPAEPKDLVWLDDGFPKGANVTVNEGNESFKWVGTPEGPVYSGARSLKRSGKALHQVFFTESADPITVAAGDRLFAYVYLEPSDLPKAIMLQFHTDSWNKRVNWGDPDAIPYGQKDTPEKLLAGPLPAAGQWVRLEVDTEKLQLKDGTKISGLAFTQFGGTAYWDKAGRSSTKAPAEQPSLSFTAWLKAQKAMADSTSAPKEIADLINKNSCSPEEQTKLREYYLIYHYNDPHSPLVPIRAEKDALKAKKADVEKDIPSTMISHELEKPRPAWILLRGEYDKHGEPVGPGVPAVLPPLPESPSTNRLTFAKWLVAPGHPLTARVTVNRFWQQIFGTGIVKTAEDFGTKGDWPSHPELLDWLATDFVDSGWDVKRLMRLMVTSATYRQDSSLNQKLFQLDPENRLLARGPRFRLDAEELRDNALFLSGLLNPAMGGRGVRTYQPPGIWEAVGYTTSNTAKYSQDHGDALYRRSLYLFWKRTAPPPIMTTFDAPSREQCRARRERTNTPLQALVTMNDIQYFEASRHLGYRILREGGADDASRLRYGFQLVTARVPTSKETQVLVDTLAKQRSNYTANEEATAKVIAVGESPVPKDVPASELAAYTLVANLLLNLDEVVTKN